MAVKPKVTTVYCEHCRKTKDIKYFYRTHRVDKYPDGILTPCKECITMHVDNWDPKTYLHILEECDVPYVPDKWNELLRRYGQNPLEVTGATILGRYLSAIKINPWGKYRWDDTGYLQEVADEKARSAMESRGYSEAEIQRQLETKRVEAPPRPELPVEQPKEQEDYFTDQYSSIVEQTITADLTNDEKIMLRLKWGKAYRPEEWVQLEELYQEMMQSYDITQAGDINSLKLACKASLKANQLLDIGDKS